MSKHSKPRRGHPGTGRDPLLSIRIPVDLLERLKELRRSMHLQNDRITISDIAREAINLGLDHISGEKPFRGMYLPPGLRPNHAAEVHEAGHAVAAFLVGGDGVGASPEDWVKKAVLKRKGAGSVHLGKAILDSANPLDLLKIDVSGAVADAIHEGRQFRDVWMSPPCSSDRRNAAKNGFTDQTDIELAAAKVREEFEQPDIWAGLLWLARALTHGSRTGSQCWNDFVYGRENWKRSA